jgi:ArsR family transcriptional regulator
MDRELQVVGSVFKALADPTRVRILGLLAAGEICVCHIHESLHLAQPLVSRHLAYLRRTGLVETRKAGLWVYYRLAPQQDDITRTLLDTACHCIGHLPAVVKDRSRLEKKTGCCAVVQPAPAFSCCEESARAAAGPVGEAVVTLSRRTN